MTDVSILDPAVHAAPKNYGVAGAQEIILKGVTASFDGSAATGLWTPAVQIVDPSNTIVGTYTLGQSLAAGASADVSWFPGVSQGGGGDLVQIFDSLLTAIAASFSIPSLPQTFSHLLLVASLRATGAGTASGLLRFNGDSGTNYEYADTSGTKTASLTGMPVFRCLDNNADAGHFGVSSMTAHDYTVSRADHPVHGTHFTIPVTSNPPGFTIAAAGGQHCAAVAAAITSLTVTPNIAGNFMAGSRLTVYGMT